MTTPKGAIAAILDQHITEYDAAKRQWQCRCGVPLNEDTPSIDHRAHVVQQLVDVIDSAQSTTAQVLDSIKARLQAAVPDPRTEWAELTDPGDRTTAPAWIVDADDIEIRLPSTYKAGRIAALIANAPTDIARLVAAVEAVEGRCRDLDQLADGDRHYSRLFRAALAEALGSEG
ncbi:hypothetical protein [Pseudarthrobacter polychromogenes]|nr:hypothetical protein [Pseudarthrobacter polychromogenes]